MNAFQLWFNTGLQHILDLGGCDHILFVALLVLTFPFNKWMKLLGLVTAFTVGHCVSLVLSAHAIIHPPQGIIELLIALSIFATAAYHLWALRKPKQEQVLFIYLTVLIFGLIHGMGFSFLLKSMLGAEETITLPLLWFNLGIEMGQFIIIAAVLIFSVLLAFIFKLPFQKYKLSLVVLIGLFSLKMCIERIIDLI
jgi:hypothetical protein